MEQTQDEVVVAAFEPFGGRSINRAHMAADWLRRRDGLRFTTLPVSFARLPDAITPLVERARLGVILVGESAAARRPTFERIAVNLIDARIPDNDGARWRDVPVVEGGPPAYFATCPAPRPSESERDRGFALSAHAGTFACNAAFYLALHLAERLPHRPRVAFLHVSAHWLWANDRKAAFAIAALDAKLRSREAPNPGHGDHREHAHEHDRH